jgi:hypothetical protein
LLFKIRLLLALLIELCLLSELIFLLYLVKKLLQFLHVLVVPFGILEMTILGKIVSLAKQQSNSLLSKH